MEIFIFLRVGFNGIDNLVMYDQFVNKMFEDDLKGFGGRFVNV